MKTSPISPAQTNSVKLHKEKKGGISRPFYFGIMPDNKPLSARAQRKLRRRILNEAAFEMHKATPTLKVAIKQLKDNDAKPIDKAARLIVSPYKPK